MIYKHLGTKSFLQRWGVGDTKMSRINSVLDEFREFKNNPPRKGIISNTLHGLKKSVIILVPTTNDPLQRWYFMVLLLELVWSEMASGSIITGAMLSLLSLFAENPGAMLRTLLNDPDIDAQIAEVAEIDEDEIKLATRGAEMAKYETDIMRIAAAGPGRNVNPFPFAKKKKDNLVTRTTEDLQIAIQTVTIQIWILLTKAVTAIATAKESENRRWLKYNQQRRADKEYKLDDRWLNYARERMAQDISVRRYMVEILVETSKMSGVKNRVVELICDIGNYISEAGMAGFFLTIKYGIETKYPALALNELQADLSTVLSLMKLYVRLGEKAPYMVILEDSSQTRFAPGAYPLLWSYAMGVGSALDRAVNNLNYARGFMERSFFELGESMVEKMEGSVNNRMAAELELTEDQVQNIKSIVRAEVAGPSSLSKNVATKHKTTREMLTIEDDKLIPDEDAVVEDDAEEGSSRGLSWEEVKRRADVLIEANARAKAAMRARELDREAAEDLRKELGDIFGDDERSDDEDEYNNPDTSRSVLGGENEMTDLQAMA
uniref:Nucleocapsid n=1 Tax=Gainesville rodent jeilong virus 1 TaxID=3163281 RepID=A0AAU7T1U7_9MONO